MNKLKKRSVVFHFQPNMQDLYEYILTHSRDLQHSVKKLLVIEYFNMHCTFILIDVFFYGSMNHFAYTMFSSTVIWNIRAVLGFHLRFW